VARRAPPRGGLEYIALKESNYGEGGGVGVDVNCFCSNPKKKK
jgi:hypothetical protein